MSEFMPTMADVAREAGVSKMTVSRVLADRDVSVAMRERVLAVIKQLGYVPDASAGTLSSGRSPFIVALVPSMSSSNFADTVHSLNAAVTAHGLQLLLGDTDYDPKQEEQLLRVMLAHRPEGVMLTGSFTPLPRGRCSSVRRSRLSKHGTYRARRSSRRWDFRTSMPLVK